MKNIFAMLLFMTVHYCNAEHVFVDGKEFFSLEEAKSAIVDGSQIYLKAGIYTQGVYIKEDNISIIGEDNVIFDDAAVDGKAALVLSGDNVLVESIECQNISVRDHNGACIRFEGKNLTVRNLYAHDSQSGIMTSHNYEGFLHVEFSKFERLGGKALSTGKEGSGLKSRSRKTVVKNSILASLDAKDSRLIDVANYGELIIQDSILQQGNNSSNSQLISYGLEKVKNNFEVNRIVIRNNLLLLDREKANVIIMHKQANTVEIYDNTIVGDFLYPNEFSKKNPWYISREDARLKAYPYLPEISELKQLVNSISVVGSRK